MPACHAGGHEFESRTHRFLSFLSRRDDDIVGYIYGALVQ